jgi:hypothetical protein
MKKQEEEQEQKNYEELKKKSVLTDKFIKLVNMLEVNDKDVPKTEKGMNTKAKELIEKINKKLEKIPEEEIDVYFTKKKRLHQNDKD